MDPITIRDGRIDDIPVITTIYADAVSNGTASWELEPPSTGEMQRRFEALVADGYPYLVATRGEDLLGGF